ncbi:hypothetical protein [Rhizobium sullae]|uniref:Uncharacterized protein n=1 Tax=Rhizobium sullae TaxID=50338 RepID=A0A4R3PYK4_RHISU|nr:hypothetical protein [Rhizobium sullae]TCU13750.1 hypothetical protein EV132_111183 [Rhizobium sullae]
MDRLIGPWEDLFVERMQLAEETGCCITQRHLIAAFEQRVMDTASTAVKERFRNFKRRAERNFQFEAENGEGSSLVLNHPLNLKLVELGIRKPVESRSSDQS